MTSKPKVIAKKSKLSWIAVSDLKKSKKFFVDLLGLKAMAEDSAYGWIELEGEEGARIGLACMPDGKGEIAPGENAIITLTVDHLVESKKFLETKGIRFVGEIVEVPGHVKMALFLDPDGNKFQLVEMLS